MRAVVLVVCPTMKRVADMSKPSPIQPVSAAKKKDADWPRLADTGRT